MGWTPKQLQAITQKGDNILVAAAAGSGKTAVLVERIINKITNENVDIDKLLVVTFTNAAATEMRERVLDAIYKKLEEEPDNMRLRKQILLLNKCNISTIHAFCLEVIKNNFYRIDVSPNFRLANTPETELLKLETLEKTFDELYEKNDPEFINLINTYCSYRDDDLLKEMVLKIYKYIQSMPFPEEWLREQVEKFEVNGITDFSETSWGKILIENAKETVSDCIGKLIEIKTTLEDDIELEKWCTIIKEDIIILEELLKINEWDKFYMVISNIKFATWTASKKIQSDVKDMAKEKREGIKKSINDLKKKIFLYESKQACQDICEMHKILAGIENLVKKFTHDYTEIKREKNVIDFNDIEHMALQILVEEDELGNHVPTEIAEKYQQKFEEIAIDEYQDSNEIQEYMMKTISRGNNSFMVGDVKQSIYKFRQSRPELFIEKYNTYKDNRIQLYANFRSRENVLNLTNVIFENIMSENFGNIDYNENEYLNPGLEYQKGEELNLLDTVPELNIIDLCDDNEDEIVEQEGDEESDTDDDNQEDIKIENTVLEAKLVANKIQELMNGDYSVYDKKVGYRKLQLKDIVILLRKTSNIASVYEKELTKLGYPVFCDIGTNYFESMEIQMIINLLKIIDNPDNDIALVTVLRSPIWNFTDNELIEIKTLERNESFYKSLLANREAQNSELRNKVNKFLEDLADFSSKEEYYKLDELIWYIYEKTGFYTYVSLMKNGNIRTANLKMLFEKAKDYEQGSFKGLYNFIRFIDNVSKTGSDMGAPKLIGENEDVIRIMSIHKSKGLEFPVVFLCGTGGQFNFMDLNEKIILHPKIGIGPKYINYERKIQYDTLAKHAIKIQTKKEILEEEMRLLYVALTRSREKLFITGISKNWSKYVGDKEKLLRANMGEEKINIPTLKKAKSYLDWIELVNLFDKKMESLMVTSVYKPKEIMDEEKAETKQIKIDIEKRKINEEINKIFTWEYERKDLTTIEGKSSVSKLAKGNSEEKFTSEIAKPKFMEEEIKLTRAEIGTAVHLVMQKLNENVEYDEKKLEELLENLVEKKIMTQNEKNEIPKEKILNFTRSDLFKEMKEAKEIHKEQAFYMNVPVKELYGKDVEDKILVQGIIDLYFINKQGEIVLVDYKTDYVPNNDENVLIERYKGQLSLYKNAIEKALKKPVVHTYIYSTYLSKTIEL